MKNYRPNPKELLEVVQKLDSQKNRGRLRIFLGMCAGVGKTYAMLKAAKEQQARSINVTIGVVETHGRKDTEELLSGMKILPRKMITYKGSQLSEMDLDLILQEHPQIVLVDELAHTNIPGSRHHKRYQDVEEILSAGIDVYTTVNIQHIDSRNDQVAQITEVRVKETVPDSFFEMADQIEMMDLSPQELLQRLQEGKVYLGDRAERAKENFFKEERLTALRELALRFTAEKVDQDLLDQMTIKGIEGPWNINERFLVAISHSPYSTPLIRAARRMAYNLEAPWVALYVDTGENLSTEDHQVLKKNLSLARELGADVITMADTNVGHAIQTVCSDKNVTQIVMGRPDRRFFRDLLTRGTLLDQLVRQTNKVDIHVIRTKKIVQRKTLSAAQFQLRTGFVAYYHTAWFLGLVSLVCYGILPVVGYRALGSIFLLSILAVASISSRGPIFFAAIVSAIVWNYFFISPQFTFAINSSEDLMMVISFFVVGVVGGLLTARIKKQERILQHREERTRSLYEFGKLLSDAKSEDQIVKVLSSTIDAQFECQSNVLLTGSDRQLQYTENQRFSDKDFAVATWVFEHGKPAGWSTQTLSASPCLSFPMKGNSGIVGVIVIYPNSELKVLSMEQENFLETVLSQTSIAVERLRFSSAAQNAKVFEVSEKLHQTLIDSVSHELRTPVTTIIGASTALHDLPTQDPTSTKMLTSEIVKAGLRLDRVIENLLDMSRLEKGAMQLKKEWFEVQDLTGRIQNNLRSEIQDRKINVSGDIQILIEGDFKLLDHAFTNILLNATKYSPPNSDIDIVVNSFSDNVRISIRDYGIGIQKGSESSLFEKFYRASNVSAGGIGLGLAIAKNIIELHGGTVIAKNRDDAKGAVFECTLPSTPAPVKLQETLNDRS